MAGQMLVLGLTLLLPGITVVAQAQKGGREPTHAKQGYPVRDVTRGPNLDTPLAQAEPRRRAFDIPAQDLGPALRAFADAAGVRLVFPPEMVAGRRTPGVSGTYTPEQALQRLLAGSGLTHRFTDETTVTLERAVVQEETPVPLSPVTVTARRVATPIANIPGSVQVIEQEEIQEQSRAHRTLQDILPRLVPGLNLGIPEVNDGTGGGPPTRGRPALVLYNGVPVNTLTRFSGGDSLLLLDPDNVERIEVVRGANATFGFGAAGGVINIITPTGKDRPLTFRSELGTSFNPVRMGESLGVDTSHRVLAGYDRFDFALGLAYQFRNSTFDPDGRRVALQEEYNAYSLDGSLGYDLGRAGQLRLFGTFYHRDVTDDFLPDESGIRNVRFQEAMRQPGGDENFRQNSTLALSYDVGGLFLGSTANATFFHQRYDLENFTCCGAGNVRDQKDERFGVRTSIKTPVRVLGGTTVTYGFDFLRNTAFEPQIDLATGQIARAFQPDVAQNTYAGFAQVEVPIGNFLFSGGVRHEEIRQHVASGVNVRGEPLQGGDVPDSDLTLFNLGVVYFLNDNLDVFAGFSQGAQLTELGRGAAQVTRANAFDPEPATIDSYELGLRGRYRRLSFEVAGFYSESDLGTTLIVVDPLLPLVPIREPKKIWGGEASVAYRALEQLTVGGTVTYQDGTREVNGDTRRLSPRDITDTRLTGYVEYRPIPDWFLRLQGLWNSGRNPHPGSTEFGEGDVDSIFLVDLISTYAIGPGKLYVGIENLLNTEYVNRIGQGDNFDFNWYPEQGTRVSIGYTLRW
jgi:iron complex outermembrane receptor protein